MGCQVKVTLYSKPACVQCVATKRYLDEKSIPYDLVDLTKDQAAFDFVTGLGHRSAPVVVVERDGAMSAHWSGFDPGQLGAL